jgi:hypothetical protein
MSGYLFSPKLCFNQNSVSKTTFTSVIAHRSEQSQADGAIKKEKAMDFTKL